MSYLPRVRLRGRDPEGGGAHEQTLPMGTRRRVSTEFDSRAAAEGTWRLEVSVGDSEVQRLSFEIVEPEG